jgi:hypothetical protein
MTNILDDSYESDLTEEEHERLILMSEHAIAKPISPATQAVLDAFRSSHTGQGCLAAALRAAADQAAPEKQLEDIAYIHESYVDGMRDALACIEIIADELEAH